MFTNRNKNQNDKFYMSLAFLQAAKMLGNTKENPAVGCVITKNNNIIAAGHTSINGRPHAEQNAINEAKGKLKNSKLYVTLEPCSHYGKTPPCVNSIIKSKIKKVFFSLKDYDLRSFNKAKEKLNLKKISVISGVLKNQGYYFYKSYNKFKNKKLPFVTCKLAISKDYYTVNLKNKFVTNEFSRGRVHLMRSQHDCILTTSKTVKKDNPLLNCRIKGLEKTSPTRIIIDSQISISLNSRIIKDSKNTPTIIFYNKENKKKINLLNKLKVKSYKIDLDNNYVNLKNLLIKIKQLGFSRIFVESGFTLQKNLLDKNLVDEFKMFISGNSLGKKGRFSIKNYSKKFFMKRRHNKINVNLLGDRLISYKLK